MQRQRYKAYYCVLDFEANCSSDQSRDHEIIEFPAILVDARTNAVVSIFHQYIQMSQHESVSPFIQDLTHITDELLHDKGVTWQGCLDLFEAWCKTNHVTSKTTTFVTCGDWDLKTMLPRQLQVTGTVISTEMQKLFGSWNNAKITYGKQMNARRPPGMAGMLSELGLQLKGHHHSGIDDCHNIVQICAELAKRGADLSCPNRLREVPFHFGGDQFYRRDKRGRITENVSNKVVFM